MVRIAIVGAGRSATGYAKRIEDRESMDLSGVAVREGASIPDTLTVTHADYETLYEETEPDGVVLCVASEECRGPAVAAARRDVAVLRPGTLAGDLADGEAIVEAVDTADAVGLGGYSSSYSPEDGTAVQRAASGKLGTVGNVRLFRQTSEEPAHTSELVGPDVEFLRLVGGDVAHVFGRKTAPHSGIGMLVTLRLEDEIVGHLDVRSGTEADHRRFEVAGTDGLIEFDSDDTTPVTVRRGTSTTTEVPLENDAIANQLYHFHACIQGDADPRITLRDALFTLRVCNAIDVSADGGSRVTPSEVEA